MSSQFHQEFPSLQAAGDAEKPGEQEDEPYGPGPSLRPQSENIILSLYLGGKSLTVQNRLK